MDTNYIRDCHMLLEYCKTSDSSLLDQRLQEGAIDWGNLLYFADLNGLLGFLWKLTDGLEDSRVPWRVAVRLNEFIKKQENRWRNYSEVIFNLLHDGAIKGQPILLKGGAFKHTIYKESPNIRGIGDIDLLFHSSDAQRVEQYLIEQGFWLRSGKNGSTAFKELGNDRLVVDVHVGDPSKNDRNPYDTFMVFKDEAIPIGNGILTISHELSLIYACKHFCEHEEDFRKVFHQDDVRLFRLVDIFLLCRLVNFGKVKQLASELNWMNYLERTLWYVKEIFGYNFELTPGHEMGTERMSTPIGSYTWPWAIRERVLRLDRAEWLASAMGDQGKRSDWYTSKEGNKNPTLPL
ncbi:nucleotidyltransferase family protein [Paenibacillus sp. YYML68]|uniref:nucleotidyltransferase family protein n=1 Tax=Paenibacillus sp. YYML68 TaxID=2909250 RepID=UPI00248F9130|nr:nucleotidyltransferase family protein [Paenibacillus sp. YYML68]